MTQQTWKGKEGLLIYHDFY